MYIDNIPPSISKGVFDIIAFPGRSSASSLWYIYILFAFYATWPLFMGLFRQNIYGILSLGILLQFFQGPDILMMSGYFEYLFYFSFGALAGLNYNVFSTVVDKFFLLSVIMFPVMLTLAIPANVPKVVTGFLSIYALIGILRRMPYEHSKFLVLLGKKCFSIYLMNTICIGFVKAMGLKIMPWDGTNFLIFAPVLFMAGLFLPILIKDFIFSRIAILDKITD